MLIRFNTTAKINFKDNISVLSSCPVQQQCSSDSIAIHASETEKLKNMKYIKITDRS